MSARCRRAAPAAIATSTRLRFMFFYLLLLFTVVPLVEFSLLIWLGQHMGLLPTIGLVLFTGIVGAALAKREGLRTWARFHAEMAEGKMPANPMLDGMMILAASALLVTPGVLTDIVGFSLLIPPIRAVLRVWLKHHFMNRASIHVKTMRDGVVQEFHSRQGSQNGDVIDADYVQVIDPVRPEAVGHRED
ncbi:FxsA family protein [Calycomorphotria hydatis]|uniref:Phage T7 F exclusion suppressor FxsA n=1 Tax=Calycomorphotria hydatis TaxID=2528027 RepID=A0A517T8F9_9PLAN|nr:FxsA family protein [Calycomorphotria hydatis]QDT64638.1 phage T7 F exclusion suppressor FxsA [Calycomorphotria hydatis]